MPEKQDKLKHFLNDQAMVKAVHGLLLRSFLKPSKERDVQSLAASRIAIDLLDDAWKELNKLRSDSEREDKVINNIGV